MQDINISKYNRHWEKSFRYPYPKHREIFEKLYETLDMRMVVELIGLRRSGKTTLLMQIMNKLIDNGNDPFRIWYFTFDEEKISLDDLFRIFSKQTGIDFKKDKIFIFLDEIQKLENFQNQLKVYYDLYTNLKIFISGSTSLFIKKKTGESLAGRIKSFILQPLSFTEYLYFKDADNLMRKPLLNKRNIESEFEVFLESQFIESISFNDADTRKEYFTGIIKKIIFEDMPAAFPVDNPEILWKIIRIIAQDPGLFIEYGSMSGEIGISSKTLSNYLYYLEEAFLVKKVYNFSRNLITSEKKLKRYYLSSPSFSLALTDFARTGKLVENYVISQMNYRFFWRDQYQHEVDFISVKNDGNIVPVEIKYKTDIGGRDMKNIMLFSRKFNAETAYVIYKGVEEIIRKEPGLNIHLKPVYNFS